MPSGFPHVERFDIISGQTWTIIGHHGAHVDLVTIDTVEPGDAHALKQGNKKYAPIGRVIVQEFDPIGAALSGEQDAYAKKDCTNDSERECLDKRSFLQDGQKVLESSD